jgi:hypothetical protein
VWLVFDDECHLALGPVGWEGENDAGRVDLVVRELDGGLVARAHDERGERAGTAPSACDLVEVRTQEVIGLGCDEQGGLVDDAQRLGAPGLGRRVGERTVKLGVEDDGGQLAGHHADEIFEGGWA